MINSYDVFDTLIGRLCYKGKEIFNIIEKTKNINDFALNRIKYEEYSKDFDDTYHYFYLNKYFYTFKHLKSRLSPDLVHIFL